MEVSTQIFSVPPVGQGAPARRASPCWWATLVLVSASSCGGTTGNEDIVPADASLGSDARLAVDAPRGGDATVADVGDDLDRDIPERPQPQDVAAGEGDAGAGADDGSVTDSCAEASSLGSTYSILAAQSADCLDFVIPDGGAGPIPVGCLVDNGCLDLNQEGATCETMGAVQVPYNAGLNLVAPECQGTSTCWIGLGEAGADLYTGLLPDGKTCAGVFGPVPTDAQACGPVTTETQVCLKTLPAILSSQCAAGQQETPCLCGTESPESCLDTAIVTPNGPVYDNYACDFNTTNGATINTNFTSLQYGAGVANAIVQCAAAFGCTCCFGLDAGGGNGPGGTCRPGADAGSVDGNSYWNGSAWVGL